MGVHAYNLSTQDVEVGVLAVPGWPGIHSIEPVSKKKNPNK
jgi:hypothetical protein